MNLLTIDLSFILKSVIVFNLQVNKIICVYYIIIAWFLQCKNLLFIFLHFIKFNVTFRVTIEQEACINFYYHITIWLQAKKWSNKLQRFFLNFVEIFYIEKKHDPLIKFSLENIDLQCLKIWILKIPGHFLNFLIKTQETKT